MRLLELYIENFGKLSRYRQSFLPGLNTFCLENGAGKTTMTVFIKAMLYGLDNSHKQSLAENERKKYMPWQGGACGGWLSFEHNGKRYRIERTFSQKPTDDTFKLYELNTGAPSSDFSSSLGEELFGIDADGFERTVFISEKDIGEKNENRTVAAKLSDLVGVDGDIGDYDSAIAMLEKRRTFYQKRGGAGQIHDTSIAIGELEERIAKIDKESALLSEYEREYRSLCDASRSVQAKKDAFIQRQKERDSIKQQRSNVSQYNNMLSSLMADEGREAELLDFFGKKIPTVSDIREASECIEEAQMLLKSASHNTDGEEFIELSEFFNSPTTSAECEQMARIAEGIASDSAKSESYETAPPRCPFARIPKEEEITKYSELSSANKHRKTRHGAPLLMVTLGVLGVALGCTLGALSNYAFFAVAAFGAILIAIAASLFKRGGGNNDAVRDFIRSVYGDAKDGIGELSALIEMRAALERYRAELGDYERRRIAMEERERAMSAKRALLSEFLAKYDTPPYSDIEKVRYIAEKHHRLILLSEQSSKLLAEEKEALKRAAALKARADDFLSLYNTKTPHPLDEIRANLAEYEVLHASLTRRRSEIERFALANGINAATLAEAIPDQEGDNETNIAELDSELLALEGRKSAKMGEISAISKSIEERPMLEERLASLTEQRERYEGNLSVIKKTKELLSLAKTNMTARYLDGTCRGFKKYVSLIDGSEADFSMDTSFAVRKDDMGAARESAWYSKGTKDLYSFAVRLSLSDALYSSELPPIILDDPFSALDDKRVQRATELIGKLAEKRQILYFTCSKSRKTK